MAASKIEVKGAFLIVAQCPECFTAVTQISRGKQRLVRAKTAELPDTKAKSEGRRVNLSSL